MLLRTETNVIEYIRSLVRDSMHEDIESLRWPDGEDEPASFEIELGDGSVFTVSVDALRGPRR